MRLDASYQHWTSGRSPKLADRCGLRPLSVVIAEIAALSATARAMLCCLEVKASDRGKHSLIC
jgi:hypothetical protein